MTLRTRRSANLTCDYPHCLSRPHGCPHENTCRPIRTSADGDDEPRHREREEHEEREDRDRRIHRGDGDENRVTKLVERTWYFGRDDDDERCDGNGDRGTCDPDRDREGDDGCPKSGRPTRPPGTHNGRLDDGGPLTKGDLDHPNPPGVWVGPRADMDLPLLYLRANAADLGARPVVGAPFWESPDIFVLAGVSPDLAPRLPPALGEVALAGQPNTLYAHVWNFGNGPACEGIVEFYWVNPSLGINPGSMNLIAQAPVSLGAKDSGNSHAVVKCPKAWTPTFLNGGHECLLVRVWDNPADLPGEPKFDAAVNRHVGQRNIHVIAPALHAGAVMTGGAPGPALTTPLLLNVGPLYGGAAQVKVERVAPHTVPWLQLHTGQRGVFPPMASPTGAPTLSPPTTAGGGFPAVGAAALQHVTGDDQQIAFATSDDAPGAGEAHVYRVSAHQDGAMFGGYTVIILG